MKASIELALRTREVYQLFERRISGERLFIEAILHKFNVVINRCHKQNIQALADYKQIEQNITSLMQQMTDDIGRFEIILTKRKSFEFTKISYLVKFRPTMILSNPLATRLSEFIKSYDKLLGVVKLLHLAGCFESDEVYFGNMRNYQKMVNQMLSAIVLTTRRTVKTDAR